MSTPTETPGKLSLRERLRRTDTALKQAIANANNGTFVANAMFWKLGLKNRAEIKAIVDEYMAHMEAELIAARNIKAQETSEVQVIENFVDAELLKKVQQYADSTAVDSEE